MLKALYPYFTKNIRQLSALGVIFIFVSTLLFLGVRKQSQAFHFEDETDHITMGWMMHRFDKTLYKDLSINHQPIPVYAGWVLTRLISFTTLFDLVERIRMSMFFFGLFWGLIATLRFQWRGLLSFALMYSVGYYFFAWHVLAESLAGPVLLYLFLLTFEKCFTTSSKNFLLQKFDGMMAGICLGFLVHTLLPLWPFTFLVFCALLYFFGKIERFSMIVSGIVFTILTYLFISPFDWYREAISNNLLYFLPYAPKLSSADTARLLFFPFLPFTKPMESMSQSFGLPLLIGIIVVATALFKKLKITRKHIIVSLFLYLLLIVTNPRVFTFPNAFYSGFHLFPYVAGYFAFIFSIIWYGLKRISSKHSTMFIVALIFPVFLFNLSWARKDVDKLNEYYVQHGTQDSYARLLIQFKEDGDTFYSGPNGFGYMNIRADLPIAGRQLFHLQWAYLSPQLRGEFHQLLKNDPPEFVYLLEDTSGYHTDMNAVLKEQYIEIIQDKHRTFLYFRKDKAEKTTEAQQTYLLENDFHFRTPEEIEIY